MTVNILGTPAIKNDSVLDGGSNYTAESGGSNRIVVITTSAEAGVNSTTPAPSTLVWGTASLANGKIIEAIKTSTGGTQRATAGVWYVKATDFPAGGAGINATWNTTLTGSNPAFVLFTLDGVDQTAPVENTSTLTHNIGAETDPWSASISVIDNTVQILSAAVHANKPSTPASGWTENQDASKTTWQQVAHSITTAASGAVTYGLDFAAANAGAVAVASFNPAGAASPSAAPDVGAIVIAGLVPALQCQRTIAPGLASLSIQALFPTTAPGQLQPAQAPLSIQGRAPQVIQQTGPNAGVGSAILTLDGLVPTLIKTRTISPSLVTSAADNGDLAPTILAQWTAKPGVATLTLNGQAIGNLIKDGSARVSPDPALLALAGYSVSVTLPFDGNLAPSRATLEVEGLVPNLVQNWIVEPSFDPDVDALSVQGFAPTLRGRFAWHTANAPARALWRT